MRIAPPDIARDLESRRQVFDLFDAIWPRLSVRIELAEAYPGDNLMVRGPYPVGDQPVVLSPLAHC